MTKTGGQMYGWVERTWNPLAGQCEHRCSYCYVKNLCRRSKAISEKYHGWYRLDDKAMRQNLGRNQVIFVCSMNDLFAKDVPNELIHAIICRAHAFYHNVYLWQTKNPARLLDWNCPLGGIYATTIETNRPTKDHTDAPDPIDRAIAFGQLRKHHKLVSIEPIMQFDQDALLDLIIMAQPTTVSIGADSKNNRLPEPSPPQLQELIQQLQQLPGIELKLKPNLNRLLGR